MNNPFARVRFMVALLLAAPLALSAAPASSDDTRDHYAAADLDRLLAPIALYPDTVLSHVLIAATYPLEVAQAARWSRNHADLTGEDAVAAVEDRDWDPSVKALVAFPEILARMDEDLEWTQELGDAFLLQEADVMDRVQVLRDRAYEAGHLDSLEHVRVVREREVIYIEPAVSHVVYIPYYDPWHVYGTWWWPTAPHCWSYWHGRPARYYTHYHRGFYWGSGFHIAPTFYFTSFHWPERRVVVVHHHHRSRPAAYSGRDVAQHREARHWRHEPAHRRGVEYRSARLNREYRGGASASSARSAQASRRERGDDERQAQRLESAPGTSRRDATPGRERRASATLRAGPDERSARPARERLTATPGSDRRERVTPRPTERERSVPRQTERRAAAEMRQAERREPAETRQAERREPAVVRQAEPREQSERREHTERREVERREPAQRPARESRPQGNRGDSRSRQARER